MGTHRRQWRHAGNTHSGEAQSDMEAHSDACSLTAVRLQLAGS
jgi:hypothetical protein